MESCAERVVHAEAVEEARKVLDRAPVQALAQAFKVLGDPTRVAILVALSEGELCVCDLAELFPLTPSAVSHQLRLLRTHRLVRCRREGKMVYYTLDDDHVRTLFEEGRRHVEEIGR